MRTFTKWLAAALTAATLALGLSVAVSAHDGDHTGEDGPCDPAGAQQILDDLNEARQQRTLAVAEIDEFGGADEYAPRGALDSRDAAQDKIDSHDEYAQKARATLAIKAAQDEADDVGELEQLADNLDAQAVALGEPDLGVAASAVRGVVAKRAVEQRHLLTAAATTVRSTATAPCAEWGTDIRALTIVFNGRTPEDPPDPS